MMDCSKCRFHGVLCEGRNDQKGIPYPWSQWVEEDAETFHDKSWYVFPRVDCVTEPPPKAIPVVDGRIDFCPEVEWVGVRVAQVFDTKRRKNGWKEKCNLRERLEIPDHAKLYFCGTAKDDQLYRLTKDPSWAKRLKEYGIDYASPCNWSMYNNSTACQITWSLLKSWESAKQLSDAGIKVVPNVEGPDKVLSAQRNWLNLIGARLMMTNFQMVYNHFAFDRELPVLARFTKQFEGLSIILNGVTNAGRIVPLKKIYPFSFMSSVIYTNSWYRRRWVRQGGFMRDCVPNDVQYVMRLFRENYVQWSRFIESE